MAVGTAAGEALTDPPLREPEKLVFLVSQPRAGSTLLQLMLGTHSRIATVPETWIALHPLYALRESGIRTEYNAPAARTALTDFLRAIGEDDAFYRARVGEFLHPFYQRVAAFQNKPIVLDKTPRYYLILPELMEVFPEAQFVILFRNPLAVFHSLFTTWVCKETERLDIFRDDLLMAPKCLLACLQSFPHRTMRVGYEELVTRPGPVMEALCRFLQIPYEEGMLTYGSLAPPTSRMGDQIGVYRAEEPVTDGIRKWEGELKDAPWRSLAAQYLDRLGDPLISDLGYDPGDLRRALSGGDPTEAGSALSWDEIMEASPERIRAERDRLRDDKDWLQHQLKLKHECYQRLSSEHRRLAREHRRLARDHRAVTESRTWRLTRPLRALTQTVVGLFRSDRPSRRPIPRARPPGDQE